MESNRRSFLKKLGATTAGLWGLSMIDKLGTAEALASGDSTVVDPNKIRWGMAIDMSKCKEGCTDCIDVCHVSHNVPKFDNPKDEIKWVWKMPFKNVFPSKSHQHTQKGLLEKPFLTMCNHCEDAPCTKVCPTEATFKRKDGIVQMDFHRCIGCRFCMAGCPYGSRSFNWRDPREHIPNITPDFPTRERGVVEKCNFCAEKIDKGEKPSCVITCKEGVLTFGNINDPNSEISKLLQEKRTIQRKPELGTKPSTFYIV